MALVQRALRKVVVKRITVIEFGANNRCDNYRGCCGRNLVWKCEVFIKDEAKFASRADGIE